MDTIKWSEFSKANDSDRFKVVGLDEVNGENAYLDFTIKQDKLIEGEGVSLTKNPDKTVTISAGIIDTSKFALKTDVNNVQGEVDAVKQDMATMNTDIYNVNSKVDANVTAIGKLRTDLNAEVENRIASDTQTRVDLIQYVDSESTARSNADTALEELINQTNSDLISEIERAQSAETILQTNIDNEVQRAEQIEGGLRTDLTNEVTRAKQAESSLQTGLINEVTRAQEVEQKLQEDLTSEISRAEEAEGNLRTSLNNEISRAEEAESNIQTNVDEITNKINRNVVTNIVTNTLTANDKLTQTGFNVRRRNLTSATSVTDTTTFFKLDNATTATTGVVTAADYTQFVGYSARIDDLEQQIITGKKRITTQPTKAALDSFVLPDDAKQGDTALVQQDETHDNTACEYELDSSLQWVFVLSYGGGTLPNASNTTKGIILGDATQDGYLNIDETTSKGRVNGWQELKNSIPTSTSQLTNDSDFVTTADIPTNLSELTNDVGYITAAEVPTVVDATTTTKGIATLGATGGAARYGQKADVGLSNVDNTSDLNKPISTATQTALTTETQRAEQAEADLQTEINTINTNIDAEVVTSINVTPQNANQAGITVSNKNLASGETATQNVILRNASTTSAGTITSTNYNRFMGYQNEIDTLTSVVNTKAAITDLTDLQVIVATKANDEDVVHKAGDTMTGVLTLSENPTLDMHAATKQYVDETAVDTYHTFDSKYFLETGLDVTLQPNSIDDAVVNTISQSKVTNLLSTVSTINTNIASKANQTDLEAEISNRENSDIVLQTNIDGKSNKIMAGSGIELRPNDDGTITITAVQDLYEIVDTLPDTGIVNKIYLVPDNSGNYNEYVWVNGAWESLGSLGLEVDLSNYYNKQNINTLLSAKADIANVYSKTDTDTLLGNKVDNSTFNSLMSTVAQKANTEDLTNHINNVSNPHAVTKGQVGLGNVDNTSDVNKPISNATQTALDAKANDTAVVHTTGTETIGGVKTFSSNPIVPTPTANTQVANKQYVDTQTTGKANDSAVVHNTGNETILGTKTFTYSPIVPTPTTDTQAANKLYIDNQLSSKANDGDVIHKAGDTMGGMLTLAANPTLPMHAATKYYVDTSIPKYNFDSYYFSETRVGLEGEINISLENDSIDDAVINTISQSKITGLSSALSTINSNISSKANQSDLLTEISNREEADILLQTNIDKKNNKILAGSGIELQQNPDGTTTIRAVQDLYEIVDTLPSTGVANKIYLVPDGTGGYNEYVWVNDGWESLGSLGLEVDLSNYYNKQNTDTLLSTKANISDVYLKTDVDTLLGDKVNMSDFTNLSTTVSQKANTTDLTNHTNNTLNPHGVTKGQVGLSNVDNTSDLNKPISTATQTALNLKANDTAVVHATGNVSETVTGVKTFSSPPIVPTPTTTTQATNKQYVDNLVNNKANDSDVVHKTGSIAETIGGIKTFSASPIVPTPTTNTQVANKQYVDNQVSGKANDNAVVHTTGAETVAGIKTFSSIPVLPATNPTSDNQAVRKGYVDTQIANIPAPVLDKRIWVGTQAQFDAIPSSDPRKTDAYLNFII